MCMLCWAMLLVLGLLAGTGSSASLRPVTVTAADTGDTAPAACPVHSDSTGNDKLKYWYVTLLTIHFILLIYL